MANSNGIRVYFTEGERVSLARLSRETGMSESSLVRIAVRVYLGLPVPTGGRNDPLRPPVAPERPYPAPRGRV